MFTLFDPTKTIHSSKEKSELKEQSDQFFLTIQDQTNKIKKAKDKEIVVFLGKTGVGKSTAINYLLGCKMQKEKVPGKKFGISVVGHNEIARIGHSLIRSETLNAELHESSDRSGLIFCDTGGFMDSRGAGIDIVNGITISMMLNSATQVKIILCIEYSELMHGRGSSVVETLTQAAAFYDYDNHPNSMMFLITKAYEEGEVLNTRLVRKDILLLAADAKGPHKFLFERMARNEAVNVHVCDPLASDELRNDLLEGIYQLDSVPTKNKPFSVTYSSSTYVQLTNFLTPIAQIGIHLYSNFLESYNKLLILEARAIEQRKQYDIYRGLEGEVSAIIDKIASLENTIASQQGNISNLSSRIKLLTEKAVSEQSTSHQVQKRIDNLNSHSEIMLWSDSINKSSCSRRVPYTYTETETTYKDIYRNAYAQTYWGQLVLVGKMKVGELPVETKVQKMGYKDEPDTLPSKEFSYSGSLISRVSKSPSYSSNWVNEYQSSNSYTVTYRPNQGESANASVVIYGQYRDTSEGRARLSNERQQLIAADERCRQFTQERVSCEQTLEKLKIEVEKNNRILLRLREIKHELQNKYDEVQRGVTDVESEKIKNINFRKEIAFEYDRLNFLYCFLELSQDTVLLKKDDIKQFIALSVQFETVNPQKTPDLIDVVLTEEASQKKLTLRV